VISQALKTVASSGGRINSIENRDAPNGQKKLTPAEKEELIQFPKAGTSMIEGRASAQGPCLPDGQVEKPVLDLNKLSKP